MSMTSILKRIFSPLGIVTLEPNCSYLSSVLTFPLPQAVPTACSYPVYRRVRPLRVLKYVILAALVAVANAGFLSAPAAVGYAAPALGYAAAVSTPAITSQHSNILRSYGNLGQVSTYSKTIDTPYSSVRKSDVRVSNDALAYHAPAVAAYHAPVAAAYAAPAYAAPAVAAYHAAPAVAAYHAAPAVAAYHGAYAPAYGAAAYAAPAVAGLGVAYSAAPAVAHLSYSNAYGINYAY
ncbi:hypothetical protein ANN_16827 [Periplaneta americana]|uniref:Uncharacterized protein n=1 Tax=Periplaneta americana TaxID=6978 RepID=A0ABQ8STC0_PERAM|nr:hypothetical protein ANN_16827 [Periplaneta americana]